MRTRGNCLTGALYAGALAIAALTTAADAQVTPEQQSAIRSSCRSDFMSKCSGVSPGGKEALNCLQKNVATLSSACKAAVSVTIPAPKTETRPEPAPAPKQETKAEPAEPAPPPTAAPATAPAPTAPAATAPTSPKPPAAKPPAKPATAATARPPAGPVQPTTAQQDALRQYCANDVAAHCQGTAGKITLECLQRNVPVLTPDCQKVVTTTMPNRGPAVVAVPPAVVMQPPSQRIVAPAAPLIVKACAREIVLHCRGIEPGEGRIARCLDARIASGVFVAPRCKAAMRLSDALD